MSKNISQILILNFLSILSFYAYADSIDSAQTKPDRVLSVHYFQNIAVIDVDTDSYHNQSGRFAKKIIIRKLNQPNNLDIKKPLIMPSLSEPKLGEVIWSIVPEDLPVNKNTCIKENLDYCEYDPKSHLVLSGCYNSCVQYGPEFLAYDSKREKLYFLADTIEVGQGGGSFLGFVANLKTREIRYLKVFDGFAKGELSPSGRYLLVRGKNFITIYNTENGDDSNIAEENSWNPPRKRLHYLGDIHWLSDTQFSYQDGVRHSKLQPSFDEMKENVYDIPSKKIVRTRALSKNEYDSSAYVEPN